MRLIEAIRPLRSISAVAALMLAGLSSVQAQFAGSSADGYSRGGRSFMQFENTSLLSPAYTAAGTGGDGYSSGGLAFVPLDGSVSPVHLYTSTASGGDGYSDDGRMNVKLDGAAPPPEQLFTASIQGGDGYSSTGLLHRALDGAAAFIASFTGGNADGYDSAGVENHSIDLEAASSVIYVGGTGDGYNDDGLTHAGIGTEETPVELFTASAAGGDGYHTTGIAYQALDGAAVITDIFLSSTGGGDGYDEDRVAYVPMNGMEPDMFAFAGTTGDGYSGSGFMYALLNPALEAPPELYAGSAGDGYDIRSLPFVQYMGDGEAASGITFSGWLRSRFSDEEIGAGLAGPDEDADQDGLANLIEFALGSDPRNSDATVFGPRFRLSNLTDLGFPALADKHLIAIVRRNPLALDATLQIEVTDEPDSLWSVNETVVVDSAPSSFVVRDRFGIGAAPRRLMRLRASLNP